MIKKLSGMIFLALLTLLNAGFSSFAADIYTDNSPNLRSYTVYIPQGLKVDAVLSEELNSDNAVIGQVVSVYLLENFKYGNTVIAKAGSTILGTVVKNKKAVENVSPAQTMVRFTSIRTPYNNLIPISAMFLTADGTGLLKGKKDAADILIPPDTKVNLFFDQPVTLVAQ